MRKVSSSLFLGASILALATPAFGQAVPPQATPEAVNAQEKPANLHPTMRSW
jgi:hypothetical protein